MRFPYLAVVKRADALAFVGWGCQANNLGNGYTTLHWLPHRGQEPMTFEHNDPALAPWRVIGWFYQPSKPLFAPSSFK